MSEKSDRRQMEARFPNKEAREAADLAVDSLQVDAPMSAYVDTWMAAYKKAGGKRGS